MEVVLAVGKGARTPLEHCQSTLVQGPEPTNAHIGLCDELSAHPGADPTFAIIRKHTSSHTLMFSWDQTGYDVVLLIMDPHNGKEAQHPWSLPLGSHHSAKSVTVLQCWSVRIWTEDPRGHPLQGTEWILRVLRGFSLLSKLWPECWIGLGSGDFGG